MDPTLVEDVSSDESPRYDQGTADKTNESDKRKAENNNEAEPEGKKGKSEVWDHFERFKDKKGNQRARCNHCNNSLAADPNKNGTSALRRHLRSCKEHPDKKKDQSELFFKKGESGEGESSLKSWKFNAENTRRAIAEMVILDELPFVTVEHQGFKKLMDSICPNFKVPSRFTVARDCGNIYLEEKAKLKSFFSKNKARVSLTTDTWTSIQRVTYMVVTAHFIDDSWVLHKRIISFKPMYEHKGEDVARYLLQCIREWEIESVCTITTDNASANISAMLILRSRLDNVLFDGRYTHVRCMAHIINLIVKDGLHDASSVIERIRCAVRYIRQSPARLERFKKCFLDQKIDTKALLSLDCPTRWNSTYDMLNRAQKLEKAFDAYDMMDPNFSKDLAEKVPRLMDWIFAKEMAIMLELFKRKTTKVSASTQVVANQFFPDMMDIVNHIRKLKSTRDVQNKLMAAKMEDKCDKYWLGDKMFNKLLYFASVLDPRAKIRVFTVGFKKMFMAAKKDNETEAYINRKVELVVHSIKEEFDLLFKQYESRNETPASTKTPQSEIQVDEETNGDDDFFAEFKADGGKHASFDTKSEFQKYLDEAEEPNYVGFNILHWWRNAASKYPLLSKMAKDILAIPLSSVASESAFSTGGRVIDAYRSSLSAPIVEALICTQDWLRKSCKEINSDEELTKFDEIGKELSDRMEPSGTHTQVD